MGMTYGMIKPDAVAAGNAGNIIANLEANGFAVRGAKLLRLTQAQAEAFYEIHKERPFYGELVAFMTSGPVIALALEHEGVAYKALRDRLGDTNSEKAAAGTIRNLYGTDIEKNAMHGSDSEENAAAEIAFFFSRSELIAAH